MAYGLVSHAVDIIMMTVCSVWSAVSFTCCSLYSLINCFAAIADRCPSPLSKFRACGYAAGPLCDVLITQISLSIYQISNQTFLFNVSAGESAIDDNW